jgi:hypothetical protein
VLSTAEARDIEDALLGVDASLVSVRSTILADLAMAYARDGEVDHAAASSPTRAS